VVHWWRRFNSCGGSLILVGSACCGVYNNPCLARKIVCKGALFLLLQLEVRRGWQSSTTELSLMWLVDKPIDQPGGVPLGIHVKEHTQQQTMACSFGKSAYGSAALVKC
jgi:hypothetical protein